MSSCADCPARGRWTNAIRASDLNDDGRLDLVVSDGPESSRADRPERNGAGQETGCRGLTSPSSSSCRKCSTIDSEAGR